MGVSVIQAERRLPAVLRTHRRASEAQGTQTRQQVPIPAGHPRLGMLMHRAQTKTYQVPRQARQDSRRARGIGAGGWSVCTNSNDDYGDGEITTRQDNKVSRRGRSD